MTPFVFFCFIKILTSLKSALTTTVSFFTSYARFKQGTKNVSFKLHLDIQAGKLAKLPRTSPKVISTNTKNNF